MSRLTQADLNAVARLVDFVKGPGYVLDFTDRTFRQFFGAQLKIDIDDARYAIAGTSKGKRLRSLLEAEDDATAARVLKAIWDHRASHLALTGEADPVPNAERIVQSMLDRLTGGTSASKTSPRTSDATAIRDLREKLLGLTGLAPQARGYAFQHFLYALFELHGFDPRKSFRNRGEEIDGSFRIGPIDYLLEAKWQSAPVGVKELHAFEGKLSGKASWARGLFLSYCGFSEDGLIAFGSGKRTLCMDGLYLNDMLDRGLRLDQVLDAKARRAVETGSPFARVRELF